VESHGKSESGQSIFWPRFEMSTSRIEARSFTSATVSFGDRPESKERSPETHAVINLVIRETEAVQGSEGVNQA
jgi:hypothetical protein